mgnify:CR=1 FL=1
MTLNIIYLQSGKQFINTIVKENNKTSNHKMNYLCLSESFKECITLVNKLKNTNNK